MKRDHSKLICDIGELTALFTDTSNLDGLLQNIVEMIALHMEADVCSIYLFYEDRDELVIRATKGLLPSSIGRVTLKPGEGLTGLAFKELRPVIDGDVAQNPHYKHFSGIGEEKYASFLAVPILRGQTRIGAMTLQSKKKNYFTPEDVNVFRAITSQLATTIEMAKLLISLDTPQRTETVPVVKDLSLKFIKGRVGAQGFADGKSAFVTAPSLEMFKASALEAPMTLEDLRAAAASAEKDLEAMQGQIEAKLFDVAALIFAAQIMMLKDKAFIGAMEERVRTGVHPVTAVKDVVQAYVARFASMSNDFMREKKYDVMDVGRRVLDHLTGVSYAAGQLAGKVVIAQELLPSEVLKLSSQNVAGIILLSGGVTSHVAVLARSLDIPLVITDTPSLLDVPADTRILIDADLGNIFIDPDKDVVARFAEKEQLRAKAGETRLLVRPQTLTQDGTRVHLMANINLLGDAAVAEDYAAEGVGLYRTEFPFIVRSDFPAEEEQYVIYRRLVEMMKGREVTFRTLDIGGDKILSYYDHSKEANPFLGLRSIRFSLRHKDIFAQQIRAILRAAAGDVGRGVRIMFPMISSMDEWLEARAVVTDCVAELKANQIPCQDVPTLGMMIELPSVLPMIDALAMEAKFFSIGTNDLIQYTLAVDRTNEKVADLYTPHHPSVLRALKQVADAAGRHGCDLSVCGDMAHEPKYMPFLIGIGIRKFSLDARYIPKVQSRIAALDMQQAAAHAGELLNMLRLKDIEAALQKMGSDGE
ncbi:MAG: phosphoenolpyruvate--protein phosphotransferase [Candidatus Omnitrophica bacterium]|nr:phosphoenolpyruvate--protein phosphotransferase [Candidatus Omnitrophota bacterium]